MRRNRSNPFGRAFSKAAAVLLSLVIAVSLAEYVAGMLLKSLRDKRPAIGAPLSDDLVRQLYDTNDPALYRAILAESRDSIDTTYSPFVEYRLAPVSGRYLTVGPAGFRGNGGPLPDPAAPGPKVFVFGGSTAFGAGVANEQTIAAYLEQALAGAGRDDVRVFNFGTPSYYSTSERIALDRLLTAGIKPDVAVFIDGASDFLACTIPDVSAWSDRLSHSGHGFSHGSIQSELSRRSNLLQLARHLGGDKSVVLGEWGRFCANENEIEAVAARLDTNRRIIDATADRLGFLALFVQQPVPTYSYDARKRPAPVSEETLGYHMNAARGYPLMALWRSQGRLADHNLLWLADLEPAEGNAYIDAVHYSPRFNKTIAERIAQAILDAGRLPPR